MPGATAFGLGCNCCECPQLVCVQVNRAITGSAIEGATVEIREAADPPGDGDLIDSGTTNSTGGFCTTITVAGEVDIVVTKEGYCEVTTGPHAFDCDSGTTILVELCPSTYTYNVRVEGCAGCVAEGAEITISGDLSGTGTQGASFYTQITMDVGVCDPCPESFDLTVSATFGGFVVGTQNVTVPNDEVARGVILGPNTPGCVCLPCLNPVESTAAYSDDWGACTLTGSGSGSGSGAQAIFTGQYTYTSSNVIGYNPYSVCSYPTTGPLTVYVTVYFLGSPTCDTLTVVVERRVRMGQVSVGGSTIIAPLADDAGPSCVQFGSTPLIFSRGSTTTACSSAPSATVPLTAYNSGYSGDHTGTAEVATTACGGTLPLPPITLTILDNTDSSPISGATVAVKEGSTTIASKSTNSSGEVVFDEDDGLDPDTEYEVHVSASPCTQPTPVATFTLGDTDFTISMNCPEGA